MKIDLHIHTRTGSDGNLSVEDIFHEAGKRDIDLMSITDHDSLSCQERAIALAKEHGIAYITGLELNVTFTYLEKSVSLDFLAYQYDINNIELRDKLQLIKDHRESRSRQILENLNSEFQKENIPVFTDEDLRNIQESVDGTFGRPHIAAYLIKKGLVRDNREAFDKYLIKCNAAKYPLPLAEASSLVRNAGGILVLAHPNDPNGTSLVSLTRDLDEQTKIIRGNMMEYIDGIECWHSRNDTATTTHYVKFAGEQGLIMTGGSDCHQKPLLLGTLDIPDYVAQQFTPKMCYN
ncbi:PHP domain-containing protein [Chloroflexota bacterium]